MSWYPGPQIDWTDLEICHIDPYVFLKKTVITGFASG